MRSFLETIRIENSQALHLRYHQKRLDATRMAHGITQEIALESVINPPQTNETLRCRVIYDQERVSVSYHPYTPTLPRSLKLVTCNELAYDYKYADRGEIETLKQGSEEILIVKNGYITDTSIANIALFDGRRWLTPKTPLLAGTTRARLLDEGLLTPADISPKRLDVFTSFAVMNAMIGFREIKDVIIEKKVPSHAN